MFLHNVTRLAMQDMQLVKTAGNTNNLCSIHHKIAFTQYLGSWYHYSKHPLAPTPGSGHRYLYYPTDTTL